MESYNHIVSAFDSIYNLKPPLGGFLFIEKGNGMKKILQFRRERPFVMVDYAVVMSGQLSVYELAVYLVLCAYADSREGTCFPSYQTIAGKAGCSRRKAIDAVARLESLGLIRKEVRKNPCGDNTSNLYTIVAAPPIAAPPPHAEGTPANALCSPANAPDSPEPDSENQIHKSQNHLSIHSFEEWKEQIEYSYFEEEMPDSLPLVEMLLGIFSRLEQKPDCQALTRTIDSCAVLELLEEMREVDWKEIRFPSAYLEKRVREYLLRREALLAAL